MREFGVAESWFRLDAGGNAPAVQVVTDSSSLLEDLARFLERLGCDVVKGADSLEVSIPFVPDDKAERVLGLFLANWRRGVALIRT